MSVSTRTSWRIQAAVFKTVIIKQNHYNTIMPFYNVFQSEVFILLQNHFSMHELWSIKSKCGIICFKFQSIKLETMENKITENKIVYETIVLLLQQQKGLLF